MRRSASILAAGLCVVALGACGDEEAETTQTTAPAAETTTSTAPGSTTTQAPADPEERDHGESQANEANAEPERPLGVEGVIVAVLTGEAAPEQACGELVTQRFVRTAYGERQGCLAAQVPGATARSVEVSEISEAGSEATAVAVPKGGPYDGLDVEVALVADPELEDAWLVESLLADVPPGP